jgi:signal transduction histidine kinase
MKISFNSIYTYWVITFFFLQVNHLRGVSATAKSLEEDLEGLLLQRREDRQEIEKLRAQADETTDILEENVALRQHLATMQRDMRTLLAATSGDREEEGGGGEGGVKEGFSSSSPDKHGRLDVERR